MCRPIHVYIRSNMLFKGFHGYDYCQIRPNTMGHWYFKPLYYILDIISYSCLLSAIFCQQPFPHLEAAAMLLLAHITSLNSSELLIMIVCSPLVK